MSYNKCRCNYKLVDLLVGFIILRVSKALVRVGMSNLLILVTKNIYYHLMIKYY